jgi:flagellar hook assembly protein FlgD
VSPTSTDTPTSTYTKTYTPTYTPTYTLTQTSTSTDTPTYTPTFTDTPTFTETFTDTQTPTITPTPVPFPILLKIEIYNSAGEKVKLVIKTPISAEVNTVEMISNSGLVEVYDPTTGKLEFKLKGLQSPDQLGAGADHSISFFWDGGSDGDQAITPGMYYVNITTTDTYGHVITTTHELTILKSEEYVRVNIYNSAGELVRRLEKPNVNNTSISLGVDDVLLVGKNASAVNIEYAAGSSVSWDGLNSQGKLVESGIYEIEVEIKTKSGVQVMATKSVSVLSAGNTGIIEGEKIYPNPFMLTDEFSAPYVTIKWISAASGKAVIKVYNKTGELVKNIETTISSGLNGIKWDLKTPGGHSISSGTYVVVIHVMKDSGEVQTKILKMAVIKKFDSGQ